MRSYLSSACKWVLVALVFVALVIAFQWASDTFPAVHAFIAWLRSLVAAPRF